MATLCLAEVEPRIEVEFLPLTLPQKFKQERERKIMAETKFVCLKILKIILIEIVSK
jgi:hypothetical protein